ncbi:MAG: TonB-dependent receptor [Filimonas sp.]|nr:TonB-dependent receptor [Filimonas sp.]
MKYSLIVAVIICLTSLTLLAKNGNAQKLSEVKVNLVVNNERLDKVLKRIETITTFRFLYNSSQVKEIEGISLDATGMSLDELLTKLLQPNHFTYEQNGTRIIISKKESSKEADNNYAFQMQSANMADTSVVVTGRVTDQNNLPLAGVSVTLKGSNKGVTTDDNGAFKIGVPSVNATLVINSLGYIPQEVKPGTHATVFVQLAAKPESKLDEVIVVGYGKQKKSDVTGSITSINEKALRDVPVANLGQALQGQGAGIDVQKSGGNSHPGAKPNILIRGKRSLLATNDPLFIVDGIPFNGDLNDLNTDDIVAVDVLKDASATAIYGSRAANGVILVSTKRGRNNKPVVSYSGYAGFVKPLGEYDIMNGSQYDLFKRWAFFNAQTPGTYKSVDDPLFYTDGTFAVEEVEGVKTGRSTDWQKLLYKTGLMLNQQIGVSGGNDITQYAISGGYYKETGVYPGQSFERYSVKASVDQQLGKYFKVGVSSLNTYTITQGENSNPMGQALRASPLSSPYDSKGNLIIGFVPGSANQVYNPLADFIDGQVVETRRRLGTFSTAYIEASLAKGLKYRLNAGAEIRNDTYGSFFGQQTTKSLANNGQSAGRNDSRFTTSYTLENLLTYDKTFGKHRINFTGLYSIQEQEGQYTTFSYFALPSDNLQYYNPQYGSSTKGSGSYTKWDILSYMGRVNYAWNDKYMATFTVRSDGSSVLAPGNKYHVFPSAALAWNIQKESFMERAKAVSALKLRASYGTVGNAAINPYQTLGALSPITYNYGGNVVTTAAYFTNAPNPNLTWEYTSTLNLGVDFGLFNARLTGALDFYYIKTNSLLLPQTLPITSGIVNSYANNVGKTENKGIELHISSVNVEAKKPGGFSWSTDLNIFINRGKITELSNGVTRDITNNRFVGYPIDPIFDYKRAGIWQNTKEDSAVAKRGGLTITGANSVIGQIRYADVNGDSLFTTDDRVILGSNQPKWEGGMTNRFTYRGFDFTVVMFARVGGLMASRIYQSGSFINTFQGNYNNLNVRYWTPDNHENYYPRPNHGQTNTPNVSLLSYFDATYLKIRSLSMGYTFSPNAAKKIGAKSLRVYTTAQNPFVLFSPYVNKFNGLDPETAGTLDVDTPPTWSMIFGVNLSF